ncbi:MAG: copper resistance protein NlpE [Methylococcales bacterium]
MQALNRQLKQKLPLIFFTALLAAHNSAMAESDMQIQERVLRAREVTQQQNMDHSAHAAADETMGFHGVFYGYLPCKDCSGIKMSLSLKQKNNYLLVTQNAKESSRERYEKGKYIWDDKAGHVVLTSSKDASIRKFRIQDEGTLIQLNSDGTPIEGDQDDYALSRSDVMKSRQVHIH